MLLVGNEDTRNTDNIDGEYPHIYQLRPDDNDTVRIVLELSVPDDTITIPIWYRKQNDKFIVDTPYRLLALNNLTTEDIKNYIVTKTINISNLTSRYNNDIEIDDDDPDYTIEIITSQ